MNSKQKIVDYAFVAAFLKTYSEKKVLVGGCFDVLHIGHVRFLEAAKKMGEILIVALESDEFIAEKKHRQSLHTQIERAEILSALSCTDSILLLPYFKENSAYFELVKKIAPDYIAVTENDPQIENKKMQAHKVGGRVVIVTPYIPKKTSSDLMKVIKKEL